MSDDKRILEIKAELDTTKLQSDVKKAQHLIDESARDLNIKVGADFSKFKSDLDKLASKQSSKTKSDINLNVGADLKNFKDSIKSLQAKYASQSKSAVKLKVGADLSDFLSTIRNLKNHKAIVDKSVKVNIDANTTRFDRSIEKLGSKYKDTSIKIGGDTRSASTHIQNLKAKIDALKKDAKDTVTLSVSVKNQEGLHNVINNIRKHLEKTFSRQYSIKVDNKDAIIAVKNVITELSKLKSVSPKVQLATNAKESDVSTLSTLVTAFRSLNNVYKKSENGSWKFNIDFSKTNSSRIATVTSQLEKLAEVMQKINAKSYVNLNAKSDLLQIASEVRQIANDLDRIGKGRTIQVGSASRETLYRRPVEGETGDTALDAIIAKRNKFLEKANKALVSGDSDKAARWGKLADSLTPQLEKGLSEIKAKKVETPLDIPVNFDTIDKLENKLTAIKKIISNINKTSLSVNTEGLNKPSSPNKFTNTNRVRATKSNSNIDWNEPTSTNIIGKHLFGDTAEKTAKMTEFYSYMTHFLGRSSKGVGSFAEALADLTMKLRLSTSATTRKFGILLSASTATSAIIFTAFDQMRSVIETSASAALSLTNTLVSFIRTVFNVLQPGMELYAKQVKSMFAFGAAIRSTGTIDGQPISQPQALGISRGLMQRAKLDAELSVFSYEDIIESLSGTLPVLMQKGLSLSQAYDINKGVAGVAKLLNLAPSQVLQETRDIAQGSITSRGSQVAGALGITNADLASYKGNADELFDYLLEKFSSYNNVLDMYADTPVGALERLFDRFKNASAQVVESLSGQFKGLFDYLTSLAGEWEDKNGNVLKTVTDENGEEVQKFINKETGEEVPFEQVDFDSLFLNGDILTELSDALVEISDYLASAIDELIEFGEELLGTSDPIDTVKILIEYLIDATKLSIKWFGLLASYIVDAFKVAEDPIIVVINLVRFLVKAINSALGGLSSLFSAINLGTKVIATYITGDDSELKGAYNRTLNTFKLTAKGFEDFKNTKRYDSYQDIIGSNKRDGAIYSALQIYKGKKYSEYDAKGKSLGDVRGRERKEDLSTEKAQRDAVKESQRILKDHIASLKEVLSDKLSDLKDLLDKNEIAYKNGFATIEEYFKRKTELEVEEAHARLEEAQEELAATKASQFENEYDRLKAIHSVSREISKYTKQLQKASDTQKDAIKYLSSYNVALAGVTDRLEGIVSGTTDAGGVASSGTVNGVATSVAGYFDASGNIKSRNQNTIKAVLAKAAAEMINPLNKELPYILYGQITQEMAQPTASGNIQESLYSDHNYTGIYGGESEYDSAGNRRLARPSSEGGYYANLLSDINFVKNWVKILQENWGISGQDTVSSFVYSLKHEGKYGAYFADSEANYVGGVTAGYNEARGSSELSSILTGNVQATNRLTGALNASTKAYTGAIDDIPAEFDVSGIDTRYMDVSRPLYDFASDALNMPGITKQGINMLAKRYSELTGGQRLSWNVGTSGTHAVSEWGHSAGYKLDIDTAGVIEDALRQAAEELGIAISNESSHYDISFGKGNVDPSGNVITDYLTGTDFYNKILQGSLSVGAIPLGSMPSSSESQKIWEELQAEIDKRNDFLSEISSDIFGTMPDMSVKLREYYRQVEKLLRELSKSPNNKAILDEINAYKVRINQLQTQYVIEALSKQLDFNLNRLETTSKYAAVDIAYGTADISEYIDKYYSYINKPFDKKEIQANLDKLQEELAKLEKEKSENLKKSTEDTAEAIKDLNDIINKQIATTSKQIAGLQTKLYMYAQTPANQIAVLEKEYITATNLGNTQLAEQTRAKIESVRQNFYTMVNSWIDAVNTNFETKQAYFDALSMTNLQKEKGTNEITAAKNEKLAEGYRTLLEQLKADQATRMNRIATMTEERATIQLDLDSGSLKADSAELIDAQEKIKRLNVEIARTTEEQRAGWQNLIDTTNKLNLHEELAKTDDYLRQVRSTAKQALEDGLVTFLTDGVLEAENLGEALSNLVYNFLKEMQKFFAQKLVLNLMNSWFPVENPKTGEQISMDALSANIPTLTTEIEQLVAALRENTAKLSKSSTAAVQAATTTEEVVNTNATNTAAVVTNTAQESVSTAVTQQEVVSEMQNTNAETQNTVAVDRNTVTQDAETASSGITGAGNAASIPSTGYYQGGFGVPYGMQPSGIGASLGNGLSSIMSPITKVFTSITDQLAGFLNSSVFTNLFSGIESVVGSAGAQLMGSVTAISAIFSGDSKERLLGMIYLELQLIYTQLIQILNMISLQSSLRYATGGYISGEGTGTSDSIPAMLSNGEYVIKASAVRKYGANFLDSVNSGAFSRVKVPVAHFSDGGLADVSNIASKSTADGLSAFAHGIGTNISNTNNISIGLLRDDEAIIGNFLKSSKGQRYLLDFNRNNASLLNRF